VQKWLSLKEKKLQVEFCSKTNFKVLTIVKRKEGDENRQ
jgi:hypothetical protein